MLIMVTEESGIIMSSDSDTCVDSPADVLPFTRMLMQALMLTSTKIIAVLRDAFLKFSRRIAFLTSAAE